MIHHLNRQNRAKSYLTLLALSLLLFIAACNAKGLPEARSGENVALSRQPFAVVRASDQPRHNKTATFLTAKNWHTLTDGGTPWQVDWSKLRMNLNSEGELLAAGEREEPGGASSLRNAPDTLVEWGEGPAGQTAAPQRAGAVDMASMQRLEGVKKVE